MKAGSSPGLAVIDDDYSVGFHRIGGKLTNSTRLGYKDFIKTLRPRYSVVWAQMLAGHASICVISASALALQGQPLSFTFVGTVICACLLGYAIHYLSLFHHAAAHYNLASDRKLNDLLANIFVGVFLGYDIKSYRVIHFAHHRYLGTPEDPENGYILPLHWKFLLATSIRILRIMFGGRKSGAGEAPALKSVGRAWPIRFFAFALHGSIIAGAVLLGLYAFAAVWLLGLVFFPWFTGLRLTLEHRSELARAEVDYNTTPHGAMTRTFGSGPIASTFGAAGFNRHLLHHWEMQLSYTRLKHLEEYLRDTELAPVLQLRETSYLSAFRQLFGR